jgi:hypothetical protein
MGVFTGSAIPTSRLSWPAHRQSCYPKLVVSEEEAMRLVIKSRERIKE